MTPGANGSLTDLLLGHTPGARVNQRREDVLRLLRLLPANRRKYNSTHRIRPRGGTADASVLGADVRKDVGVRVSPRPFFSLGRNSFDTRRRGGRIG
jgi:hypothetical protein